MDRYFKKNKGFTLIEILATVTILGILSVVAMVSVNSIIQNAKEKHYTNAEDQMELAGQSYAQQYRSVLPKAIGQKVKIPMRKLVETNYIEQIKDYSDNNCDPDKSYVQIFKYSQEDYSYLAYLDCPVYDSNKNDNKNFPDLNGTEIIGDMDDEKQWLRIVASDDSKLISYSYIIYKYDKEVKNSGSIYLPNYDTKLSKEVGLKEYTPGTLKVVVTATNIYGNTSTKTVTMKFNDTKGPKCIIKTEDLPSNPKEWGKDPVKITVKCDDKDGSGCEREEYTKTFKDTATTDFITIKDNAGNKTKCEVSVNIDLTPPTVPTVTLYKWSNNITTPTSSSGLSSHSDNTWVNLNLYSEASASVDENVGFKHYQYILDGKEGSEANVVASSRNITTEGTSTIKYRACDLLDNCSEYSEIKTIKLDKTAPDVPTMSLLKWKDNDTTPTSSTGLLAYTSGAWSNLNIYVVPNSPEEGDDTSKIKEYQYTTTGATTNKTNQAASTRNVKAEGDSLIKYRTCDNAGNCSAYTSDYSIRLDKTKPIVTITTPSTTENNSSGITVYSTCTDERSGVASQTGSSNTGSPFCGNVTHRCTDNAGNVGTDTESYTIKYYSAVSSCGVASWNYCSHSECGTVSCNCSDVCSTWYCEYCNAGRCGAQSQNHACDMPGVISSSCTGYTEVCNTCNKSCRTPGCGVESYNTCWHC